MQISTATDFGTLVKQARLSAKLTQAELAAACGTGTRFIIELEQGKGTCQIEKALRVARRAGLRIEGRFPE
jgi:HTH-type transcriptional regulator / antitoxin HipB